MRQALDLLTGYSVRWRTRGGLLRGSMVIVGLTFTATRYVGITRPAAFATAAITLAIWVAIWLVGSGRIRVPRTNLVVVFAVDVDVEAERNFQRIFGTLRRELRGLSLRAPIILRRIAPDLVADVQAAHRYIENFEVDQVVWGRALSGKAEGQKINKFDLLWTQRIKADLNIEAARQDVRTLLMGRKWRITDLDELNDLEIVAEDFVEVCLGIVGIALFVEDRTDDAIEVLSRVVNGLEHHARQHPSTERRPQIIRYRQLLNGARMNLAIDAHANGDNTRVVELLEPVLAAAPDNINALMTMARARYYLGDIRRAIHYTEQIRAANPEHPSVPVNLAFFNILEHNYEEVVRWYDQLLQMGEQAASVIPSVSAFLEERYQESPNEHAFLYGMAVVNGFFDDALMRDDLEAFLERTESHPEYEPLRERADHLLRR